MADSSMFSHIPPTLWDIIWAPCDTAKEALKTRQFLLTLGVSHTCPAGAVVRLETYDQNIHSSSTIAHCGQHKVNRMAKIGLSWVLSL